MHFVRGHFFQASLIFASEASNLSTSGVKGAAMVGSNLTRKQTRL